MRDTSSGPRQGEMMIRTRNRFVRQANILFSHSAIRKGVPITSPGMDQNYVVINNDDNIIKSIGNVAHGIV